ncbi:MAG: polymer-forming cytoskeletal protein [Lachnospiraceae bacterium]|nr:polymer-forming cytoskeletal protein [Lachnospiraceae bacterium]
MDAASENEESEDADTSSEKTEDADTAMETDKKDKTDSLFDVDLEKAALEAVLKQEEKKENNKKGKENSMEEKQTDDNINEAEIIAELMEADTDISISQKEENENVESILSEDTTYVTKGTTIKGSISTEGGIDLIGTVEGDVECKGKLIVGGCVKGNVVAGEVYANAARIEGETKSDGSVKIGVGTVVVGNIIASSAVIAGAVNGDIDVKGSVIVDSTAVIMGNIKSRSVQINNGAVIEGFCSQCYSEIDVKSFFE